MKKFLLMTSFLTLGMVSDKKVSFYDFKAKTLQGAEVDFQTFKGKKVLIVNLASHCGYTPQYEDLQKLHEQYGKKVAVLGFPSNSFYQELESNEAILSFCKKNFGVTFTVFEKIDVKGSNQHPLYQWLSNKELNGWNDKEPSWNFNKYLVDENGKLIKHFGSSTKPLSKDITNLL